MRADPTLTDHKPFTFYTDKFEHKSIGEDFYITGYASTNDLDLVNDIVTETAFQSMASQMKDRNIKIDYEHESLRGNTLEEQEISKTREPLGKIVDFKPMKDKIQITAKMNPQWKKFDTQGNVTKDFNEIKKSVEQGYLDAFSIAFYPIEQKTSFVTKNGEEIRQLQDLKLVNVALTGNPVNTNAKVISFGQAVAKSLQWVKELKGKSPESKPFAGYTNMEECIKKNSDKKDPKAYCVTIMNKTEGKSNDEIIENLILEVTELKSCKEEKKMTEQKSDSEKKEEIQVAEKAEPVVEQKSVTLDEFKNKMAEFENKLEVKSKEIAELKAKLAEPFMKGKMSEPEQKNAPETLEDPLNLI